jgi:hypothetical protein
MVVRKRDGREHTATGEHDEHRHQPLPRPRRPPHRCHHGSSSDSSGSQGQDGGTSTTAPSDGGTGGESASDGGGAANAGNHRAIVGTLKYLAPGKLTVTPEGGGTEQAFLISNATQILGAAAICSDDGGSVSLGDDGYGTSKCTVDELEKSAKTNSVTVRVTMNPKSGAAETVEEKYHP